METHTIVAPACTLYVDCAMCHTRTVDHSWLYFIMLQHWIPVHCVHVYVHVYVLEYVKNSDCAWLHADRDMA